MTRLLLSLLSLTLIYALTLGSFDPWDLLVGAVVSAAVLLQYRRFLFGGWPRPLTGLGGRLVAFVPFAWATVRDITVGTWYVTLVVLHLRPLVRPGIVAVPMEERSPDGVVVTGLAVTLSPGSVLLDLDWERRLMLFHLIDASDPEAVRAAYHDFYYRLQRKVFP